MDPTIPGLRVLREIAERGSFTAAAQQLRYTQSAVSRQIAALEREVGAVLCERRPDGARLTPAGLTVLRHARVVLDELDATARELAGSTDDRVVVRLGLFISAGAVTVPRALAALRRSHPEIAVTTREGTTPSLVRAVRAGTVDLAVVTSRPPHRPPDDEAPRLVLDFIDETSLLLAVPAAGRFAGRDAVDATEIADADWIATPSSRTEPLLGVWPGLAGRPNVVHTARDWLTKLRFVAAGLGVTTVPASMTAAVPAGVRLVRVTGVPEERRRTSVARLPGRPTRAVTAVVAALQG